MSHSALGIAETIQSASIKRHPSPRHDINPSTAASEKVPYEEADPSDAASITSDILDQPALRPVARRRDLPPLPDLRFEQSYLASLRCAETWQRVAWITIRDQVGFPRTHIHTIMLAESNNVSTIVGPSTLDPRYVLDTRPRRMAVLESQCTISRKYARHTPTTMVVFSEQLAYSSPATKVG